MAQGSGSNRVLIIVLVLVLAIPAVLAVVGVMAALAIYGVRKYISDAKAAEAQVSTAALAQGIVRCAATRGGLPPTSSPVPSTLSRVSGRKYQSAAGDWSEDAFTCAGFALSEPQYFQYQWVQQTESAGVVVALADLDGDGLAEVRRSVEVKCTGGTCQITAGTAP